MTTSNLQLAKQRWLAAICGIDDARPEEFGARAFKELELVERGFRSAMEKSTPSAQPDPLPDRQVSARQVQQAERGNGPACPDPGSTGAADAPSGVGMTPTQTILDDIQRLEAELAGKRMELAMSQGRRELAKEHMKAMHKAINARREFRLSIGLADDGCFFNAAGHADQVRRHAA